MVGCSSAYYGRGIVYNPKHKTTRAKDMLMVMLLYRIVDVIHDNVMSSMMTFMMM